MISSPEDKAGVKARAIPYIIGAILTFAAVNVVAIISNIAQQVK